MTLRLCKRFSVWILLWDLQFSILSRSRAYHFQSLKRRSKLMYLNLDQLPQLECSVVGKIALSYHSRYSDENYIFISSRCLSQIITRYTGELLLTILIKEGLRMVYHIQFMFLKKLVTWCASSFTFILSLFHTPYFSKCLCLSLHYLH